MRKRKITPPNAAAGIQRMLKDGGSAEHGEGVQWFFKDEIKSHGWYTAALRTAAVQSRRHFAREHGMNFVMQVADQLFSGRILEEKVFAVFLLEKQTKNLGDDEFQLFASWIDRITSWADHDALVHDLLAPMMIADPARDQSRAAFMRGVADAHQGHYTAARDAFLEAYTLFAHPSILMNLGIARWHTGEYVQAERDLALQVGARVVGVNARDLATRRANRLDKSARAAP